MKILLINASGAGFANHVDIEPGTTTEQLFNKHIGAGRESQYLVRVNRMPVARDQILQEGDRVSSTPLRIEGATA
ncbi:molybdopterin converting factor [Roseiconus lacunae]|uniref:molybdopterin converting factor n=1 Tax=Roseiconus lacunae TaxID=2605694 RepID=UPI001E568989|nr:molybdopterin converting factor [Roseiconus lacunae]MCD0462157.1 molybdopterin converting factor [Roseiconus lacunae]